MAALIDLDQYGTRVGEDYDAESPGSTEEQILARIDDASALVNLIAFGTTTASYWTDVTVPDAVIPVIVNMVQRGLENPLGLSGEQVGSYQWYSGASNNSGGSATQTGVYATRDERRIIRRAAGTLGVGTVQLEGYLPTSGLFVTSTNDDLI